MPSFSNFTDFDCLRAEPAVDLRFGRSADVLVHADVIILPGTKQTMSDLAWLRSEGIDQVVLEQAQTGLVMGICGGMQMLGMEVADPLGVEQHGRMDGLCLLPIQTMMAADKVTRLCSGRIQSGCLFGQPMHDAHVSGYEIHVGKTVYLPGALPFAVLQDGEPDGCVHASGRVLGTYLHGIFDDDGFRHPFVTAARTFFQLAPAAALNPWKAQRAASFDRLAQAVRDSLDLPRILSWVGLAPQ